MEQLRDWRNSPHIRIATREVRLLNTYNQKQWWERVSVSRAHLNFIICLIKDNTPIGSCGLVHIDYLHRFGEASIFLGQTDWQRKGYAKEALTMLMQYGFEALNLHKITAEIYAFNQASIKLFEGCGFKHEGTLRDHHFAMGQYWNSELYSILEHERRINTC